MRKRIVLAYHFLITARVSERAQGRRSIAHKSLEWHAPWYNVLHNWFRRICCLILCTYTCVRAGVRDILLENVWCDVVVDSGVPVIQKKLEVQTCGTFNAAIY